MNWTQSETNILVAGHRGNPAEYPENTMSSFQSALSVGVDMIELDIHMTRDGELVIIHNDTVDETTDGSGLVKAMSLKEIRQLNAGANYTRRSLQEKIPLFKEFLEFAADSPDLLFDFELKEYPLPGNEKRAFEAADKVIRLIEDFHFAERCVLNAFHAGLLQYVHDTYQGRYKLHGYYPKALLHPQGDKDPYDILYCACVCEDFTPETFQMLKARSIDTWVGTRFKDRTSLDLAHTCGATLVTCDNPAEVLEILQDMGLHM